MRIKAYLPYVGIAAFTLLAGLLAAYLNLQQRYPVIPATPASTILLLTPGKPLPDFHLQTADGKPLIRASLAGQWILLYFSDSQCSAPCPATLTTLAAMVGRLQALPAAQRPHVYIISLDPEPAALPRLWEQVHGFDPGFVAATGTSDQLKLLTTTLGVNFSDRPMSRTNDQVVAQLNPILVIDPGGRQTAVYIPPLIPDRMADNYRFIVKLDGARP